MIQLDIFVTQIIGFLIVLWVLRKFAWGPILAKLDERRDKIAGDVTTAENLRAEADRLREKYEEELRTIEAQARERIQLAVSEGQKVAEEIRADARAEADRLREKTKADLELEVKKARSALHDDIVRIALDAATRLVNEEMNEERQRKLVNDFLAEIPGLKTSS
jgi:F-type H+-transporting ATPase subunit b